MNDVQITLAGNVAKEPQRRITRDQTAVCSFRIAAAPRRFDRAANKWVDGNVMYFGVTCWRQLADHVNESVAIGDRVVVVGRLTRDAYTTKDGEQRESWEISADSVSVDLRWATARPVKQRRSDAAPQSEQVAAMAPQDAAPVAVPDQDRYATEAA